MQIRAFNTGRLYSSKGQRIAFSVTGSTSKDDWFKVSKVVFVDIDRQIQGEMNVVHFNDAPVSNRDVLTSYDAGDYSGFSDQLLAEQLCEEAGKVGLAPEV